jgi:hypothetical protein
MNLQKKVEDTIKEYAQKINKPYHVVLAAWLSQFKFTRAEISSLNFKTIKLPNWGKYIASPIKLENIDYTDKKEAQKKKLEDKINKNKSDGANSN